MLRLSGSPSSSCSCPVARFSSSSPKCGTRSLLLHPPTGAKACFPLPTFPFLPSIRLPSVFHVVAVRKEPCTVGSVDDLHNFGRFTQPLLRFAEAPVGLSKRRRYLCHAEHPRTIKQSSEGQIRCGLGADAPGGRLKS